MERGPRQMNQTLPQTDHAGPSGGSCRPEWVREAAFRPDAVRLGAGRAGCRAVSYSVNSLFAGGASNAGTAHTPGWGE